MRDIPAFGGLSSYIGLFLAGDREWVEPETVGPGCAVLLKGERGEPWWQVLDEGDEPRTDSECNRVMTSPPDSWGRGQGDTLVLREGLEDLSYEIAAVQSKFVRAFQETANDSSTRFPEHTGLSSVTADDDGMVGHISATRYEARSPSTYSRAAPAWRLWSSGGTGRPSVTSSKQPSGQRSAKNTKANPSGSRCERHVRPHARGVHPRIAEAQRRVLAYSAAGEAVSQAS